jgi:hypothetical protein
MFLLDFLPGIKSLLKVYKLPGHNPYEWDQMKGLLQVSRRHRKKLTHKIAMVVNIFYIVSMALRMLTKSFDFSMTSLSVIFFVSFIIELLVRQNWKASDGYLDCINSMMRFERVLIYKENLHVPASARACW